MITWVKSSRLEKEGKEPLDLEGKGQALDWGKMGATQFWTITLLSDSQSLPHMQSRTIGIAGLLNETMRFTYYVAHELVNFTCCNKLEPSMVLSIVDTQSDNASLIVIIINPS